MKLQILALVPLLALGACSGGQPTEPPPPSVASEPSKSLEELRVEYELPECPETDPAISGVEGGLPQTELACLGTDQTVNLAGLPRRPMVVNLWAQWCAPCRAEAPFLRGALQKYDDVDFLGINYMDPQPDWAIEFAGLVDWNYPHVMDQDKTLQKELGVPGIPMTLFVDADGLIQHRHPGQFESQEQLDALIEEHL